MLNAFKSKDPVNHPHDYEFFVNEVNTFMYFVIAFLIIQYKRVTVTNYYASQPFLLPQFLTMGFLDSFSGFLSCVGGAYVQGAVQSLINQITLPVTLGMSAVWLGAKYGARRKAGAFIILLGAAISLLPSLFDDGGNSSDGGINSTTKSGVLVFFLSTLPGSASNVYKEKAFKESNVSVDIYYMTTWITLCQVVTGAMLMPLQRVQVLGGVEFKDMSKQISYGNACMLGENSLPGDDCSGSGFIMVLYVAVNFFYNVFTLLVVKHGSASLSVIASAIALPATNMSFSVRALMGPDTEKFHVVNVVSTMIVIIGFGAYSRGDGGPNDSKEDGLGDLWTPSTRRKNKSLAVGKSLPLAAAGGSVMYMRPRSDSDPTTPGYAPLSVKRIRRTPVFRAAAAATTQPGRNGNYGSIDGGGIARGAGGPIGIIGTIGSGDRGDDNFEPSSL